MAVKARNVKRDSGLKSPWVLIPAVVCLLALAVALTLGVATRRSDLALPVQSKTYDAFVSEVRGGQVASVVIHQSTLVVAPKDGAGYYVIDASPYYTMDLLLQQKVQVTGVASPTPSGSWLGVGVIVVVILPYLLLGWGVFSMSRAVTEAAAPVAVGLDAGAEEKKRPSGERSVRDSGVRRRDGRRV